MNSFQKLALALCAAFTFCIVFVAAVGTLQLSNYPDPFIGSYTENLAIVVGDYAEDSDVVAAVDILQALQVSSAPARVDAPAGPQRLSQVGPAKLASEVLNPAAYNAILVGGPCANSITAELLNHPDSCYESVDVNKTNIRLITHSNGNVALIVNGRTAWDTRLGARAVAAGMLRTVDGLEAEVTGTTVANITVTGIKR